MRLLFLFPGRSFSDRFVHSWTATMLDLSRRGVEFKYAFHYHPIVYVTRNSLLGGNPKFGPDQKPFQGNEAYDYIMWIDDDMVWTAEDIYKLVAREKDIIGGCYMMADQQHIVAVEDASVEYALKHDTYKFLTPADIKDRDEPFIVDHAGFGFLLVRHGVFEKIAFPWFEPHLIDLGPYKTFSGEDVGFCWKARQAGFETWLDPTVRVGHEKKFVLNVA